MDNMFSQETLHYVSKLPLAGASATLAGEINGKKIIVRSG